MSEEEDERVAKGKAETRPIAERIEEGTARHEPVTVHFRDGKEHTVEVYAISTRQFRQAVKKSHLTMQELEKIANIFEKNTDLNKQRKEEGLPPVEPEFTDVQDEAMWDFFQELTAAAVKNPPNILDQLFPNGEVLIAPKVLEMSRPPKNLPSS